MEQKSKKIVALSMYSALSLIAFVIENLFPSFLVPGAKTGLSNVFVLLALVTMGEWQAYVVMLVKCTLGSFIVGNLSTLIYSLAAGATSLTVMVVLYVCLKDGLSLTAVSVAGAVAHNVTQNVIYVVVTNTTEAFLYLPYLALLGAVSGVIVGICAVLVLRRFKQRI